MAGMIEDDHAELTIEEIQELYRLSKSRVSELETSLRNIELEVLGKGQTLEQSEIYAHVSTLLPQERQCLAALTRAYRFRPITRTVTRTVTPKETKGSEVLRSLPEAAFQNPQLGLFQGLLANTDEQRDKLSNAIDLWDSIPRYSVSRQAMTKARVAGQFLQKHEAEFQYRGQTYVRTIHPAGVVDLDGQDRDYYPSSTEELVEDALRKIATEQRAGYFDRTEPRSGVTFTLYKLREELKRRGHARSYQQLVIALNILSGSIIEIASTNGAGKGEGVSRSPYFPHLAAVSQTQLRDDPQAKWAVQFHPLVARSIDELTYRQYNYAVMMSHRSQLARWLHKQLTLKYTFAEVGKPFEMRHSTIKRDSGLLEGYKRVSHGVDALVEALEELKEHCVLMNYKRQDIEGPRGKFLDVIFELRPSAGFVSETKASNKRKTEGQKQTLPREPQRTPLTRAGSYR